MKLISFAFILALLVHRADAQSLASGYYITQKSDTLASQIKLKKGLFGQISNDFTKEVEVIDSVKGTIKFLPEDIKGYGFLYEGRKYAFMSKPIKNGPKRFLAPFFAGPKSSLYLYGIQTAGGGLAMPSKQVFYTFEKSDGTCLFLRNILNNNFRNQLKEFYKDNTVVQQLVDTKFRYWLDLDKDLLELLRKVNIE